MAINNGSISMQTKDSKGYSAVTVQQCGMNVLVNESSGQLVIDARSTDPIQSGRRDGRCFFKIVTETDGGRVRDCGGEGGRMNVERNCVTLGWSGR